MFNRNEWLQWAQQNQNNNTEMNDFRSEYWRKNDATKSYMNPKRTVRENSQKNEPVELNEGAVGDFSKWVSGKHEPFLRDKKGKVMYHPDEYPTHYVHGPKLGEPHPKAGKDLPKSKAGKPIKQKTGDVWKHRFKDIYIPQATGIAANVLAFGGLKGPPKEKPEPVGRTSREFETESIDLQRKAQQLKTTQKNLEEIVCGGACIAAGLGLLTTAGMAAAPAMKGMIKGKPKPGSGSLMKGNKISQQTQQIVQNRNSNVIGKIGPGQQKMAASYEPEGTELNEVAPQERVHNLQERVHNLQERVHNLQEIGFLAPLLGGLARVGAGAAKVGAGAAKVGAGAAKVGAGVARAGAGAARGVAGAGRAAGASLRNVAGKIKPKIRPKINAPVVKPTSPLGAKPVVKPVGAKPSVKPVGAKPVGVKPTVKPKVRTKLETKPVGTKPSKDIPLSQKSGSKVQQNKGAEGSASKSAGDAAAQPKGKEGLLKKGAKRVAKTTGDMLPWLAMGAMQGGGGKPDNRTDVSHPTGSAR